MSSNRQYTDEFKAEAIKQVIERGFTVVYVATRIGIPKHTLYEWVHKARKVPAVLDSGAGRGDAAEVRRICTIEQRLCCGRKAPI